MSAVSKRISKRVKGNEEKLKEPQTKKMSLSNSMQKLQLEQEKEKEKKEEEKEEVLEEEVVEVQATARKGQNPNKPKKTMEKVQTDLDEELDIQEDLEEDEMEVQATTSKGRNQNKPKKLASAEQSEEKNREIAELKKQLRKSNIANYVILCQYFSLFIFWFKGEARLAELDDQEEKKEDQKKRGPKPKKKDEEKSKFLTVKYSIDEKHPLNHLDGTFFAVNLEDLTCKFNPDKFKVGDHVKFMKIYKDEVIPLEGNYILNFNF